MFAGRGPYLAKLIKSPPLILASLKSLLETGQPLVWS
jgi:hypothetical protein